MSKTLLAIALLVAWTASHGAESGTRQHGAHEHGAARLNIAWEGNTVEIELESPAMNLVGFEHRPRTTAQKKTVHDTLALLKNAERIFSLTPEARCRATTVTAKTDLDAHAHSRKHHDNKDEHAEFHANYRYTCEAPDALRAADVHLFDLFPKTQRLRTQLVSPHGQSATELKPGNTRLTLR